MNTIVFRMKTGLIICQSSKNMGGVGGGGLDGKIFFSEHSFFLKGGGSEELRGRGV